MSKSQNSYIKLSKSLHLTLNNEELKVFEEDFAYFLSLTKIYDEIKNLSMAEPMIFPFPLTTEVLDEDEVNETEYVNIKLNANNVKDNYIVLPKVVR